MTQSSAPILVARALRDASLSIVKIRLSTGKTTLTVNNATEVPFIFTRL